MCRAIRLACFSLILSLAACSSGADRVTIVVRNHTARPLKVTGKLGGYSRTLKIDAGGEWEGWIPHASAKSITVEIAE